MFMQIPILYALFNILYYYTIKQRYNNTHKNTIKTPLFPIISTITI